MNTKADILIIGGGIIGLSTAYYLTERGADVLVVDKGELGHGSSLHNAGYICPSHFVPLASPGIISQGLRWMLNPASPFYMKLRLDPEFLSWAWTFRKSCTVENVNRAMPLLRDLGNESLELYKAIAARNSFDFEFVTKGLFTMYVSERGRKSAEVEAEHSHELGIRAELMSADEVHRLVPEVEVRAAGGLFFPDDCHMTPAKFVQGFVRQLESRNVRFLRNTAVTGLNVAGGRVAEVQTSAGSFSANQVVLAGGSWSPGIAKALELKLPVQAGKGYSITIPRTEKKPLIPMILSEARVAVTSMGDTIRFAGTMELAGVDLSITQRRVQAILDAVPRYIGGFDGMNASMGDVWAGLRPVTPDGLPLLGRFRNYPNLIAATGHSMIGVSLGPVTGKIVADIASGETPAIDISLLNPDRFG